MSYFKGEQDGDGWFNLFLALFCLASIADLRGIGFVFPGIKYLDYAIREIFFISVLFLVVKRVDFRKARMLFFVVVSGLYIVVRFVVGFFVDERGDNWSLVTYLVNPDYSISAWLFFIVMGLSTDNGLYNRCLRFVSHSASWPALFLALISCLIVPVYVSVGFVVLCATLRYWLAVEVGGGIFNKFLLSVVFVFALAVYNEERMYAILVLMSFILYALVVHVGVSPRIVATVGVSFCLFIPVFFATEISADFFAWLSDIFYYFGFDSLFYNTRSFVFDEFFDDMGFTDLLFGRGFLGRFFSPYFSQVILTSLDVSDHYMRSSSEVGWMHTVLKIGFLGLLFFSVFWLVSLFRLSARFLSFGGVVVFIFNIMFIFGFNIFFYPGVYGVIFLMYLTIGRAAYLASGGQGRYSLIRL